MISPETRAAIRRYFYAEHWKIGTIARELRKFGAQVDEFADGLTIRPPASYARFHGASIATYNDHRMAMSLALAGLKLPGVMIQNPGCTAKTYPAFFRDLQQLVANRTTEAR